MTDHAVSAIILAAGLGERMGAAGNKMLLTLAGEPLLLHAVRPFACHPEISEVVIVVRPDEEGAVEAVLEPLGRSVRLVPGGATRRDSALHGVRSAVGSHVVIHDGARPFTRDALITRVLDATLRHGAAIPVLPSADTLHVKNERNRLVRTLDRASIVRAQTPQGFLRSVILDALEHATRDITDDAAAVLASGNPVHCVAGHPYNLKITHPEDIALARGIARALAAEGDAHARHPVARPRRSG